MTKSMLEQYPYICKELEELEKACILPYRREELERYKNEIERFMISLPESKQRLVVMLRAMHGLTWQQVAGKMGHKLGVRQIRRIYKEVEKNFLSCP